MLSQQEKTKIINDAIFNMRRRLALYTNSRTEHTDTKKRDHIKVLIIALKQLDVNADDVLTQAKKLLDTAKTKFPEGAIDLFRPRSLIRPEGIVAIDDCLAIIEQTETAITIATQKAMREKRAADAAASSTPPELHAMGLTAIVQPYQSKHLLAFQRYETMESLLTYFENHKPEILADVDAEALISQLLLRIIQVHYHENFVNVDTFSAEGLYKMATDAAADRLSIIAKESGLLVETNPKTQEITYIEFGPSLTMDAKMTCIQELSRKLDKSKSQSLLARVGAAKVSELSVQLHRVIHAYQSSRTQTLQKPLQERGDLLEQFAEQSMARADATFAIAEKDAENALRASDNSESISKTLEDVQSLIQNLEQTKTDMSSSLETLEKSAAALIELQAQAETLQREIDMEEDALNALNQQLAVIQSFSIDEKSQEALHAAFDELLTEISHIDISNTQLSASDLTARQNSLNRLAQRLEKLQQKLTTLSTTEASTQGLKKLEEKANAVNDSIQLRNQSLAALPAIISSNIQFKQQIAEIQTHIALDDIAIAKLREELDTLQKETNEAIVRYESAQKSTELYAKSFAKLGEIQQQTATTARQVGASLTDGTPINVSELYDSEEKKALYKTILDADTLEALVDIFKAHKTLISQDQHYSLAVLCMHRMARIAGGDSYKHTFADLVTQHGSFYHLVDNVFKPLADKLSQYRSGTVEVGRALLEVINSIEPQHQQAIICTSQEVDAKNETMKASSEVMLSHAKGALQTAEVAREQQEIVNASLTEVNTQIKGLAAKATQQVKRATNIETQVKEHSATLTTLQTTITTQGEALKASLETKTKDLSQTAEALKAEVKSRREAVDGFITEGISTIDSAITSLTGLGRLIDGGTWKDKPESVRLALDTAINVRTQLEQLTLSDEQKAKLAKLDTTITDVTTTLTSLLSTQVEHLGKAALLVEKLREVKLAETEVAKTAREGLSEALTIVTNIQSQVDEIAVRNEVTNATNAATKIAHQEVIAGATKQHLAILRLRPIIQPKADLSWDNAIKQQLKDFMAQLIRQQIASHGAVNEQAVRQAIAGVLNVLVSEITSHYGDERKTDVKEERLAQAITTHITSQTSLKGLDIDGCVNDIVNACQIQRGIGSMPVIGFFGKPFLTKKEDYASMKKLRGSGAHIVETSIQSYMATQVVANDKGEEPAQDPHGLHNS